MQKLDVNCFKCISNGLDKLVLAKPICTHGGLGTSDFFSNRHFMSTTVGRM